MDINSLEQICCTWTCNDVHSSIATPIGLFGVTLDHVQAYGQYRRRVEQLFDSAAAIKANEVPHVKTAAVMAQCCAQETCIDLKLCHWHIPVHTMSCQA